MAFEESNGAIIVTGKEDIRVAALLALAHGIVLELETGMKPTSRWNALAAARNHGVIPSDGSKPQKKKLLRLTVQAIRAAKPDWEPSEYLSKALAK
jgi:hypothetical protein